MNQPPPIICPNCGAPRDAGVYACPNCGNYGRPRRSGSIILWAILLGVVGLPGACFGGCFLLMGTGAPTKTNSLPFIALGLAGVGLFTFFLWMLIRASRAK
jgi:hypothetical protein